MKGREGRVTWQRTLTLMPRLLVFFSPKWAALLLLALAACAPAPAERVSVVQPTEPPTYYPHSTGAIWRYLPEGEVEDAQALAQQVEGPTVIDGRRLTAWRTTGRGLETRTYRDYRTDGVYIPRETGPGYVTTIRPALREWPRAGTLRVGLSWSGTAQATIDFTDAGRQEQLRLEYRYEVVDRRPVETTAGSFDVFVVALESRSFAPSGQADETLRQELWFTPFIGEVKTDNGLVLVGSNLLSPAVSPAEATGELPTDESTETPDEP